MVFGLYRRAGRFTPADRPRGRPFARVAVATLVAVLLGSILSGSAAANQFSPPWADLFYSHWPGGGGLDTGGFVADVAPYLNAGGYEAWQDSGSTAAISMSTYYAQSDAVWAMYGHGGPGFVTQYNSTYGNSVLNASPGVPGSSCTSPNDCISNYSYSQLHAIRLMVFWGCETGQTVNGVNILNTVTGLGVDSSIAWSGVLYTNQGRVWNSAFFYSLIYYGYTVGSATSYANNAVISQYGVGNMGGMNTWQIGGSPGVKLVPALYGS